MGWQGDLHHFRLPLKDLHRHRLILTKRVYHCRISFSALHNWRALNNNWYSAAFIRPYHWACCQLSVLHVSLPRHVGHLTKERTANFQGLSAIIHERPLPMLVENMQLLPCSDVLTHLCNQQLHFCKAHCHSSTYGKRKREETTWRSWSWMLTVDVEEFQSDRTATFVYES